jgi:hypothetical protein
MFSEKTKHTEKLPFAVIKRMSPINNLYLCIDYMKDLFAKSNPFNWRT